jgi:bifunctional DNA primase/polymerase-like protein
VTTPGGCSCCRPDCHSPAKHPRVAGGLTVASVDPATIAHWWRRWPSANVAIRTGAVSGIIVLDVDPDHGGDESLDVLLHDHGPLPPGAIVRTGSGGQHIYFAHPGGVIRNDTGRRLGPGLDIRGDGGYVIAPPSRHPTGSLYHWDGPQRELPHLPDWLLDRLRDPVRPPARSTPPAVEPSSTRRLSAWAKAALERELANVSAAQQGTRNDTLNRSSYSLGQIVGSGALNADDVECLLLDRATAIGLGEREARATIASGLSAGARQPRWPTERTIDLRTVPLPGTPSSATRQPPAPKPPIVDVPGPT